MSPSFSILYVTIGEQISSKNDGVAKKLIDKIMAIRRHVDACLLLNAIPCYTHNELRILEENELLINMEIGVEREHSGYLSDLKSSRSFFQKLGDYISDKGLIFDRFIVRYPFASTGLMDFTERFNKRIIFEHNTKETEELKKAIREKEFAAFSLRPSAFFFWFREKVYPLYCERHFSSKIFSKALAGSCVTTEIAEYEARRARNYRTFVSSNFYNVGQTPVSTAVYDPKNKLCLGMIVTTTASWYGLERLIHSFSTVQDQYVLKIAGIDADNSYMQQLLQKYGVIQGAQFLGKIGRDQLADFYNSVHVCFGSLGLYTINLSYASTLKVKESIAFSVPVVVGYNEEDFIRHSEFKPYYIQVSNDGSAIDFDAIRKFAREFYADADNKRRLRDLALRFFDVNVKVEALLKNIRPQKEKILSN